MNSPSVDESAASLASELTDQPRARFAGGLTHYARRTLSGELQIVDRRSGFVRATMPYDYAHTSNAQQWTEAARLCEALEPTADMSSVVTVTPANPGEASEEAGKVCTRCGVWKPLTGFYTQPSGRGGRHAHCRECARVRDFEHKNGIYNPSPYRNGIKPRPPMERLRARISVDEATGCHVWTGGVDGSGYASTAIIVDGQSRHERFHRIAYEDAHGPIPKGLVIDHLCRNRRCCNPEHLEAVTQGENVRRGESLTGKNSRKTHCKRGHEFTPENIIPAQNGGRVCRTCTRERQRHRYAAKQAAFRAARSQGC